MEEARSRVQGQFEERDAALHDALDGLAVAEPAEAAVEAIELLPERCGRRPQGEGEESQPGDRGVGVLHSIPGREGVLEVSADPATALRLACFAESVVAAMADEPGAPGVLRVQEDPGTRAASVPGGETMGGGSGVLECSAHSRASVTPKGVAEVCR